jgi:hypothetical protein
VHDLERKLKRWTEAGLITPDQARDIIAVEQAEGRDRALPVFAEVVVYVGAVLALSAVAFVASRVWEDLAAAAQLGVVALGTSLLWGAGWWIRGAESEVRQRLMAVLWFLSAGGMGWLADVVAIDLWDVEEGYGLIIGIILSVYAALLYAYRRTSLQQIALAGGVGFVCGGLSDLAGGDDWFGLLLWVAGAAWTMLAYSNVLTPRRTAFALGGFAALAGSQAIAIEFFHNMDGWGLALGVISAGALLYLSVSVGEIVLLALGVGGLFLFLLQIVDEYLAEGLGGPLTLFVAGVLLLSLGLVSIRLKSRMDT